MFDIVLQTFFFFLCFDDMVFLLYFCAIVANSSRVMNSTASHDIERYGAEKEKERQKWSHGQLVASGLSIRALVADNEMS